jgi:dTDP-4-dehydrorhamnose 3,5-epimerase-like enzyme
VRHDDYFVLLTGRASIGLRDLRAGRETAGGGCVVDLVEDQPLALTIPRGVAHGFFFHERSLHAYAVSHYWDPEDELACRWDDPDLGIPWPVPEAQLSERDAAAPALSSILARLRERHL